MLFTLKEINFIEDAHERILECMNDVMEGRNTELPSNITEELSALHTKGRNIHSDDPKQNQMKVIIVRSLSTLQAIKIEKMNSNKDSLKSQTMLFHGVNALDREQIIKIKHQLSMLLAAKKTCDTFINGVSATKQGMSAVATAAKRGAGIVGEGIVSGAKKTGGGAISVGKGIVGGAVIVGGGVAFGATAGAKAAWEYVLDPAGKAIAGVIEQAITAMQNAVRRENINDANKAIKEVVKQAQSAIDNSLRAIENVLHILYPSLSPAELTDKAKKIIDYDHIEESLIAITEDVIDLQEVNLSSKQAKYYINYFNNQLDVVQTAVSSVVEIAEDHVNDAQRSRQNLTSQQQDEWLLEELKGSRSLKDLKNFINTLSSSKGSFDEEDHQNYFNDIATLLAQAELLAKQKNRQDYSAKFSQIIDDLNSITNSSDDEQVVLENLSAEDIIKLTEKLHEAVDNIAEFDRLQYALEHTDKLDPFLKKAEHFLSEAQESQDNMVKPLKKAKNALKASDSFAAGVLRLGEKGLNYVLSNIKSTITNIWESTRKFITGIPEAVKGMAKGMSDDVKDLVSTAIDKLLEITGAVTSKISELSDNFVKSMQTIIGIRKAPENKNAIYQHQAFQPDKIREVIQDNLFVKNLFIKKDEDSNPVEDIITPEPDKEKLYPYKVTTKLKFIDYNKSGKEISYEVDLMVVYKDSICFSPALDINHFMQKGYIVPIDERDKFEDAKLELIKILGNDDRGLLSTPRAESIKIKHFNAQGMEVLLDTRVMREQSKKFAVTGASQAVLEELQKRSNPPKKSAAQKSLEEIDIRAGHVFKKSR